MKQPISLDIETTGLDPREETLLMYQVRQGKTVEVWDARERGLDKWKDQLEDPEVPVIIHNSSFDATWIKVQCNISIRCIRDTMLREIIILGIGEQARERVALAYVLSKYRLAKLDKSIRQTFIGHTGPLTRQQMRYGKEDIMYLEPLLVKQDKVLKKMGLVTTAQLEDYNAEVNYSMRATGICFDTTIWNEEADKNESLYQEANRVVDSLIGGNKKASYHVGVQQDIYETKTAPNEWELKVNWNSHKQVKDFFAKGGVHINSLKELPLHRGHPLVDAYTNMRQHYKNVTTYGHTFPEKYLKADGRIYPEFNQIVSTGRWSCREPNMQNLPADGTNHRRAFRPSPGYLFANADFTGQELGIMAYGSQEPSWLEPMLEGKDLHSVMAKQFFPEWEEVAEEGCVFPFRCKCELHQVMRQRAKRFNFGIPYGKGGHSIAEDLGITVTQAYTLIRRLRRVAPSLVRWLNDNGTTAVKSGYVRTLPPFNRYRDLSLVPEDWRRRNQGFNTPVQGSGADMIKLSMWYAHKRATEGTTGGRILLCVHDELVTEAPKETVHQWAQELKESMAKAAEIITMPGLIRIEPVITDTWEKQQ